MQSTNYHELMGVSTRPPAGGAEEAPNRVTRSTAHLLV